MTAPYRFELRAGARGRIVRRLQQRVGVAADGVLGPKTLAAASKALGRPSTAYSVDARSLRTLGLDVRLVVDLSGHNEGGNKRPVDFRQLAGAGVFAVWLKASEGASYFNDEAIRQAGAAVDAGLWIGCYHFGDLSTDHRGLDEAAVREDARWEADHYLASRAQILNGQKPKLADVLDVERELKKRLGRQLLSLVGFGPLAKRAALAVIWCLTWLEAVEVATGRRPWVYTAKWVVDSYLRWAPADLLAQLATYNLWVASYNDGCYPKRVPSPWAEVHCHQFTGRGEIGGVDGLVDLNWAAVDDLAGAA